MELGPGVDSDLPKRKSNFTITKLHNGHSYYKRIFFSSGRVYYVVSETLRREQGDPLIKVS